MAEDEVEMLRDVSQQSTDAVGSQDAKHEEGWVAVTDDNGVRKRTISTGSGETPQLHSICLVHYQARHQADGSIIVDTRAEKGGSPVTIVAGRDCVQKEKGLNLAMLQMSVGESCQVAVCPEYAYGEKGNFSFPSVKPNAHIEYEIELLGITPPQEKERKNMFFEERLEAATRMRATVCSYLNHCIGKRLFSEGDVSGALAQNSVAIEYVDDELLFQLEGFHLEQAQAVRAPLHLNVAACHLALDQWQSAADAATAALAVTAPDNKELFAKALFRRARARKQLRQTEQAINDLEQALKRCADDVLVIQELAKLRKQLKAEQKAVDNLFRNKIPTPSTGRGDGDASMNRSGTTPPQEATTAETQRYTTGETWFFCVGKFLIAYLLNLLHALGILPKSSASTASKT